MSKEMCIGLTPMLKMSPVCSELSATELNGTDTVCHITRLAITMDTIIYKCVWNWDASLYQNMLLIFDLFINVHAITN